MSAAVAVAVVLASCSAPSNPGLPLTGSSSTTTAGSTMSLKAAGSSFLSIVCPLDTSLHVIDNLPIAAGGWELVEPSISRAYVVGAAGLARSAASQLSDEKVLWPETVTTTVAETGKELLNLVSPLQRMAQARSGTSMGQQWTSIIGQPHAAEQELRLKLGLPAAGATTDGCPLAPPVVVGKVKTSAVPTAPSKPTTTGPILDAEAINWQSTSGTLRCAFFPHGSIGESVACIDASANALVRLNTGQVRLSNATPSQAAQLPGGQVLILGGPQLFLGQLSNGLARFSCWQAVDGMTCLDMAQDSWFIMRMGQVWLSR